MVTIGDPYAESPGVPAAWRDLPENKQLESLRHALGRLDFHNDLGIESVTSTGRVTVSLRRSHNAATRGVMLRAYEDYLNQYVATGLRVFVKPEPDRNALRRLRGIVVKDEAY